ncbi:methyltransferase domain-containing protein [Rhizobium sp.]|jgi:predicted TPR repeat methyltransferase|uniref:methyltransferase domain-containing protein n=1 Tax=Rhizobium sp. TaxID=391 RepID=UPI000E873288|nr:SAM-dependent methyltransferase [Rhizobium sp.]
MHPIQIPSGNAVADRRADYARMLGEGGDHAAASELMEQALELAPQWVGGWFLLGEYRTKSGNVESAAEAYRQVLVLNPTDMFAAGLKLALIGADSMPPQPPSSYVEALFDDYANRFETSLVQKLEYRVPQKLVAMMTSLLGADMHFHHAIDLGCGTGLMGVELKPFVTHLEGYDLSGGMLVKAAEKHIYDHLAEADLSLDAEDCGLFSDDRGRARADLITAADVLMYLGALPGVFSLVENLAADDAFFVFSVETQEAEEGFSLASSLRYQHGHAYVVAELERAGFTLLESQPTTIRMDGGKPIAGFLFIAKKLL